MVCRHNKTRTLDAEADNNISLGRLIPLSINFHALPKPCVRTILYVCVCICFAPYRKILSTTRRAKVVRYMAQIKKIYYRFSVKKVNANFK